MNWLAAVQVALDGLSTMERLAASVAAVALLVGVFVLARRIIGRRNSRLVNVVVVGTSLLAIGAIAAVVVVVWNLEAEVQTRLLQLEVQAKLVGRVALTFVFFAAVYVGTGVIHRGIERVMKQRDGISDHQAEITYRILQILTYVIALIAVLGFWEVDLSGLLIGAGFAGIVLGMAARQTLGAVIAGLVLMFSRPFEIGDWVEIGDNDGIVTDITIVNTRLQTFDGEYVMLPNDYVGSSEVVNRSRKGRLRIHVEVGVDYSSDVDEAMNVAKEAMGEVEDILTVPRPQVVLSEFGDSAVVLDLRFWIDKPSARRRWRAQTAVISAVKSAFDEAGVKIPFPQRELTGRAETGGFRVRDQPPDEAAAVEGRESDSRAVSESAVESRATSEAAAELSEEPGSGSDVESGSEADDESGRESESVQGTASSEESGSDGGSGSDPESGADDESEADDGSDSSDDSESGSEVESAVERVESSAKRSDDEDD